MNRPETPLTQQRTATLTFDDGTPALDLPVLSGTVGPEVVDIRNLYGKTGKFTMALPELLHVALRCDVSVVGMRVLDRVDRIYAG